MARTRSLRFNLWRWSDDADFQTRADFDDSAAEIEARGAKYGQGTLAAKGAAGAANVGTFWRITDAAGGGVLGDVYYSDGATWDLVATADTVKARMVTAVADLLVGSGPGAIAKLPKSGVDGRVLMENAASPYGMDWLPIPASVTVGGAAPTTSKPGDAAAQGADARAARLDHRHGREPRFRRTFLYGR